MRVGPTHSVKWTCLTSLTNLITITLTIHMPASSRQPVELHLFSLSYPATPNHHSGLHVRPFVLLSAMASVLVLPGPLCYISSTHSLACSLVRFPSVPPRYSRSDASVRRAFVLTRLLFSFLFTFVLFVLHRAGCLYHVRNTLLTHYRSLLYILAAPRLFDLLFILTYRIFIPI